LGRRQILGDVNRNLIESQLNRRQTPDVPDYYNAVLVDYDGLSPPERCNAQGHLVDRLFRDSPRVFWVRPDLIDWPQVYFHGRFDIFRSLPFAELVRPCRDEEPFANLSD
jgi:hypothetical protein